MGPNSQLIGIMALIAAEQAGIDAIKMQNAIDADFPDRPATHEPYELWAAKQRLEELYVRAINTQ